jgi:uncharacterized membrane protein YkvA (DUF1232 family)
MKQSATDSVRTSWAKAYVRFLLSTNENLLLKVAPLALLGLLPLDILSNLVPVVGEMDDFGFIIALAVVAARTLTRVRRYR